MNNLYCGRLLSILLVAVLVIGCCLAHEAGMEESGGLFSALSSLGGDYMGGSDGMYWFAQQQRRAGASACAGQMVEQDSNQQTKHTNMTSSDFIPGRSHYRRLLRLLPSVVADVLMFILDNPLVGVVGLGSLVAVVKNHFWWLHSLLNKQLSTSLEVNSDEACYEWLLNWLHGKDWGTCSHVRGVLLRQNHGPDCGCRECQFGEDDDWGNGGGGATEPAFALVPNLTSYGFEFEGRWITIGNNDKNKDEEAKAGAGLGSNNSILSKTLTLSTTGSDPAVFSRILAEARGEYCKQMARGTTVYTSNYGHWNCNGSGQQRKRPLDSVVLEEGVLKSLMDDIQQFIASANWYINLGIPYRRGYLLYGPPGCGKTSVIAAIAGQLDFSVGVLSLGDPNMCDQRLSDLMTNMPSRCVVLMEDIDAAFHSRVDDDDDCSKTDSGVTFSGLLNALDGVGSSDARILFMTTNYPERLDPALIRPGRVDIKKRIGYCTEYQIRIIFKRFFVDASESVLEEFLDRLRNREGGFPNVTPASLQGFFLLNRYSALGVLSSFEELFRADERLQAEACMQKDAVDTSSVSDVDEKPKKNRPNNAKRKAAKRAKRKLQKTAP